MDEPANGRETVAPAGREETDQRRLQESERRYRELFEFVPVSLWEVDASEIRVELDRLAAGGVDLRAWVTTHPEELSRLARSFKILSINAYGCQLAGGRDRDEILANLDKVEIPEAAARYADLGMQLLEGRTIARAEGWGGTVGGEKRLVETAATVLPGHEATWDRLILASVDVTDRHRSEARLTAIFDAAAEPMAFTFGGRFERVNTAFARTFGFARPADAIGLSVGDLVTPSELPKLQARHRQRIAGEPPPESYTTRCQRRDGTEFDVEVKTAALREGDRIATVSIMRDVTEQRAWERKLTESERRFRELFELIPVSLWEVDLSAVRAAIDALRASGSGNVRAQLEARPDLVAELTRSFRILSINTVGYTQVGARSREELMERRATLFDAETFPRYRELGLQLLEGRKAAFAEGWSATVTGERRWLATTATALPGNEEDWGRIIFASVDLTERKQAEEERALLHERLRQAEKLEAVGRLAGGIAHDFNNILSGILGYAELSLLGTEKGSDVHDHQERIREAALRARMLVRQILTFSRRDSARQRVVDVPAVVREALGLMRAGVPSTVTLEARIDPDAGATVADPTQIHQVILNLCSNARDAVGPYGRITVEVAPVRLGGEIPGLAAGEYVRLRVVDDGAGMDEETKARIFEPYMTTKGPFGGHGLGLPVVHGIVSSAGGAIHVESAPGRGSTFDVYLPRRELAEPAPPRPQRSPAGRGERILLVDDEPLVLSAHRRLLESLGYCVTTAADGKEALTQFQAAPHAYDLVLADQTMPALSGADLARAILAIRAEVPVILCTGYSDQIDEPGARRLGVRALLQKPIDRQALAAAVELALRT